MKRECGECSVCCYVGAVPELDKTSFVKCKHIQTSKCGSCKIFQQKNLPSTCSDYECAWKQNFGRDFDRPDRNGVMFTHNILEGQVYFTAIETREGAIVNSGRVMATEIATRMKIPIIVVEYGKKPPHDTGNYVIVHDDILPRCKRIVGDLIEEVGDGVTIYELMKGK